MVLGHHLYIDPGVYAVTLTVTDDSNGTGQALYGFVVVLDRRGGVGFALAPSLPRPTGRHSASSPGSRPARMPRLTYSSSSVSATSTSSPPTPPRSRPTMLSSPWPGTGALNGYWRDQFRLVVSDGQWPGGDSFDRVRLVLWDPTGTLVYEVSWRGPGCRPNDHRQWRHRSPPIAGRPQPPCRHDWRRVLWTDRAVASQRADKRSRPRFPARSLKVPGERIRRSAACGPRALLPGWVLA